MKILHISDTHCRHNELTIDESVDMIIHSGDATNDRNPFINGNEMLDFIKWYSSIPIQYKIFVAGNHDVSVCTKYITKELFESNGIIYLENSEVTIRDLKIYGSPITPTYGIGWAFNKDRSKIYDVWKQIPDDTDIVVTHGPPKGVLDVAFREGKNIEFAGCNALMDKIVKVKPLLHLFGHLHTDKPIRNGGFTKVHGLKTIFSNGSVVEDKKFDNPPISHGNIFRIDTDSKTLTINI